MSNPWDIKKEDFPVSGLLSDKIKFVLGYAILAPSTHNSQPWLFKIDSNSCKIYYDPKLKLPQADPKGRDLYISLGCMAENIMIASNYFGIFKELKLIFEGTLAVEIVFRENGERNSDLEYLLDTIPRRVNVRGVFEDKTLPDDIGIELLSLNKDQRIRIRFVDDKEKISKIASLTAEGLRMAHGRPIFRQEMSKWMTSSLSSRKDGLPGYSLRMPFLLSFIIPVLVKFFDLSLLLAKLNRISVSSAPLICFIESEKSSPEIWFETGRLAERLMLHLQSKEIMTSIFVASIEIGDLYKKVQEVIGNDLIPQFLFCVGYMNQIQGHSPRHKVEKKIIA
ncbi:MAG: hypothetical protein A3B91_02940 [Candidatus Yanofskybacteria bacterium RIFCSPHIGHO2_02_FULL_41_29]|uniref:Nitroreductase domain-containing protein n=1 Tax=Candidatus Yanofskybacteria bacterium RIFCSPHIGHO2_01_FULL_41_53 TaxID=1802663 RepID=A0A1F8EJM6_9BACT|nr:MAG: hypothetical protein A2650_02290 [Candidatus Yanofskybacteria bacterium RIFCSPHIGHO2_01_FULL_41_53]OGN12220.1 MAG: hypothetical protein A3B91_02940 [Candidatus Yanofskybacteria bacterium RIFCSPHIGHO2_02_FULL_41_29]OGN18962.1 MAG: hypothetical protein A3F48_03885 [Candidatus Yanofskybacteria bacterium RIFCSPHIGHO2_12_FULL_41_9]OGN23834.1 MAG: hypothetical protein A2916_01220 [Candidatus Yanofskybacteria bacterium RIFCSPLOWO2_01_FULL_41_67]OGN28570.1 MAG: hypothetical protein A3H54_04925 